MKLEQSFTVAAEPQRVFETLLDIGRVASCLPGADITEEREDGSWAGSFTVKLGPTTAAYTGALQVQERDDAARSATMSARGQDKRGQGGASATISSVVHEDPEGARVEVVTDYSITGRLARFGRGGMIQDISNRLLRDFSECLQARIESAPPPAAAGGAPSAEQAPAPPPPAKPVGGFSLLVRALLDRVRNIVRRRP